MGMIYIGTSRAEAIDWVQETLGPVTPRNVAEDTYRSLIAEGVVNYDGDEIVLTEDMTQDDLRTRARNDIISKTSKRVGRNCATSARQMSGRSVMSEGEAERLRVHRVYVDESNGDGSISVGTVDGEDTENCGCPSSEQ